MDVLPKTDGNLIRHVNTFEVTSKNFIECYPLGSCPTVQTICSKKDVGLEVSFVNCWKSFESKLKVTVDNISVIDASLVEGHPHALLLRLFLIEILRGLPLDLYYLSPRLRGPRSLGLPTLKYAISELHDLRIVIQFIVREVHNGFKLVTMYF